MNLHHERRHMQHRREQLQRLLQVVGSCKECDQCRSIVPRHAGLCPFCATYRFKEDVETVRATLELMSEVPWPRNSGFVPRLACEMNTNGVAARQKPCQNRQEFEPARKRKKARKSQKKKPQ